MIRAATKKTRDGGGGGVMIGMISIAVAVYICVLCHSLSSSQSPHSHLGVFGQKRGLRAENLVVGGR